MFQKGHIIGLHVPDVLFIISKELSNALLKPGRITVNHPFLG